MNIRDRVVGQDLADVADKAIGFLGKTAGQRAKNLLWIALGAAMIAYMGGGCANRQVPPYSTPSYYEQDNLRKGPIPLDYRQIEHLKNYSGWC